MLPVLTQYRTHLVLAGSFLLYIAIKHFLWRRRNPNGLPPPPGPRGYPIIGNLLAMPLVKPWLVYHEWCKSYGGMIYFEVLGQPFLILGTLEKVTDIFEKRSSKYSGRVRLPMLGELMGNNRFFAFQSYGPTWKKHRRAFHDHFHQQIISKYHPVHTREARAFLQRLVDTPQNFQHHIIQTFAANMVKVSYGYTIDGYEDPYIQNAEALMRSINQAGQPGAFLVDFIPALKYVPDWFPGAGFKKKAAQWRELTRKVSEVPYEQVKERMKNGTSVPCIASDLIEALPEENSVAFAEEEQVAINTPSVAYFGGADTTHSAIKTFFLAMMLNPEVMKKAQQELDSVLLGRLPEYSDKDTLPYISAVVNETLRWRPVTNLAFPHMSTEDDEYQGYFIPKGTIVFGNTWAILHDPDFYERPDDFIPERFLTKDGHINHSVRSPTVAAFGFGRRVCPGRHFADDGLFMIVASTLAVCDILPPLDATGKPFIPNVEYSSTVVSAPLPYECRITPRSAAARVLIEQGVDFEF